ncbi:hypothetical protein JTB14_004010 [Gonioctena quinquepunctata]|nr:hypothetical protein JTB14_004010 [Gonioctena quinquepunctata]
MSRFAHYKFFRRFSQFLHSQKTQIQSGLPTIRGILISDKNKLLIGSQVCGTTIASMSENEDDIENRQIGSNIEEDLKDALEKGDEAILSLMHQLKEFFTVVSQEYRNCLVRQMNIMEKALTLGPHSETWDEIPHYRSLADKLQNELNEYVTLFNTLGHMANEKSLVDMVSGSMNIWIWWREIKELEVVFLREIEENKKHGKGTSTSQT